MSEAMAEGSARTAEQRREALVERVFGSAIGMMELLSIYVGERLGLYRALAATPSDARTLARSTGTDPRYVDEWLRGQAAGGYVEYDADTGTYSMTPEQRIEWEAEVRSLYDGMVRIVVTPTWAKLIDFETTLPSAVEELVRQRDERQRA